MGDSRIGNTNSIAGLTFHRAYGKVFIVKSIFKTV
jgi:hypothetical protein